MKLLFLTKKPTMKRWVEQEFAKCCDALSYTIDVACVNSFIIADKEAERFHMNTEGFERFTMKTRAVPDNYKIDRNYLANRRDELLSMLHGSNYAYVVNACYPNEAGDLMFDYTREICDILNIPTLRFDMGVVPFGMNAEPEFKKIDQQIIALMGGSGAERA